MRFCCLLQQIYGFLFQIRKAFTIVFESVSRHAHALALEEEVPLQQGAEIGFVVLREFIERAWLVTGRYGCRCGVPGLEVVLSVKSNLEVSPSKFGKSFLCYG